MSLFSLSWSAFLLCLAAVLGQIASAADCKRPFGQSASQSATCLDATVNPRVFYFSHSSLSDGWSYLSSEEGLNLSPDDDSQGMAIVRLLGKLSPANGDGGNTMLGFRLNRREKLVAECSVFSVKGDQIGDRIFSLGPLPQDYDCESLKELIVAATLRQIAKAAAKKRFGFNNRTTDAMLDYIARSVVLAAGTNFSDSDNSWANNLAQWSWTSVELNQADLASIKGRGSSSYAIPNIAVDHASGDAAVVLYPSRENESWLMNNFFVPENNAVVLTPALGSSVQILEKYSKVLNQKSQSGISFYFADENQMRVSNNPAQTFNLEGYLALQEFSDFHSFVSEYGVSLIDR